MFSDAGKRAFTGTATPQPWPRRDLVRVRSSASVAGARTTCDTRAVKELSPAYLSAIAGQLGTLSAFLGGFAATFLATLLTLVRRERLLTVCLGLSVTSAVAFIVTVVAATMVTAVSHPDAPAAVAASAMLRWPGAWTPMP